MLLEGHRALKRFVVLALVVACGDNLCPDRTSPTTCRVTRIEATSRGGQLGFRIGEPIDLDGDRIGDIVAGSRYAVGGLGEAGVWSGDRRVLRLEGEVLDGLFGHVALGVPDLDDDGRADIVVAGPLSRVDGSVRGIVDAYTLDGHRIWRAVGIADDGLGWQVSRAGDHDGDGVEDLWATAPSNPTGGHVYLLSGRDGRVVLEIASTRTNDEFGWYVAQLGDLDGDGRPDLAIGSPTARFDGVALGSVTLVSSATGATLREVVGELRDHLFGQMIVGLDDLDGDGVPDLAVGAPNIDIESAPGDSEVHIVSGATGRRLRLLTGNQRGELFGRMLAVLDDLDGDGLRDLAIGAPWADGRQGRIEIRSARSLALLAEVRGGEYGWLGWHIERAGAAAAGPGFVATSPHTADDTGTVEVFELR